MKSIDIQRDYDRVRASDDVYQHPNTEKAIAPFTASPDISPPNSPIADSTGTHSNAYHGDVSPIDPEPMEFPSTHGNVSLGRQPSLRDKLFPSLRSAHGIGPTKWDKYTGERTNKQTGKAGTSHNTDLPIHKILAQMQQSRAAKNEKRRSSGGATSSVTSTPRPPWRGASGRQADIPPILSSPLPTQPTPQPVSPTTFDKQSYSPVVSTTEIHPAEREIDDVADTRHQNPVIAQIADNIGKAEEKTTRTPSPPTPRSPTAIQEGHQDVIAETLSAKDFPSSPRESIISRKALPATSSIIRIRQSEAMHNPSSRFSWTTIDSGTTNDTRSEFPPRRDSILPPPASITGQDSPPAVANPTNHQTHARSPSLSAYSDRSASSWEYDAPPIINDKLRASTYPATSGLPTHPPTEWQYSTTPNSHPNQSHYASSITPSTMPSIAPSTATTNKALPLPPPALSATTLIEELEARMADLATQKRNLRRLRADLNTERQSVVCDIATRREAEKQLAAWKEEMEEVEKCEHEVGVRLHRAWRRKEKEEGLQNSEETFWVRRVTR